MKTLCYFQMDKNSRDNSFSFSILIPSATGGSNMPVKTIIIIASVVMLAQVDSLIMLIAAALLYGIGSTIGMPALTALIADTSDTRIPAPFEEAQSVCEVCS